MMTSEELDLQRQTLEAAEAAIALSRQKFNQVEQLQQQLDLKQQERDNLTRQKLDEEYCIKILNLLPLLRGLVGKKVPIKDILEKLGLPTPIIRSVTGSNAIHMIIGRDIAGYSKCINHPENAPVKDNRGVYLYSVEKHICAICHRLAYDPTFAPLRLLDTKLLSIKHIIDKR